MKILNDWSHSIIARAHTKVLGSARATGVFKKVSGGMSLYASVDLSIGPGPEIACCDLLDEAIRERMISEGWYRQVLFGVLDVFLVRPNTPLSPFLLTIEGMDFHEIDSTALAFRLASRDAAEKCLSMIRR